MERDFFPNIIGNKRLKGIISSDISNGRTAHAYIIEGPSGSGKMLTALSICAAEVCERKNDGSSPLPCGECDSCKRILSGISADVLVTKKPEDKASIGVDLIRPIKDTLYIAPNDGEKKFYIIKDADYLTPAAQNALLLPIEEPPEFVMFFLLCEDSASLLETVRSRAPVLRTEKFPASFIEEYLSKKYKNADKKKLEYASHLASGSLGRAVELYENGDEEAKLYKCAEELLSLMLSGKSSDGILFIRGKMPKDRADICEVLSLMRFALRDIIADKKVGELVFYTEIPSFAKKISIKRAVELYSAVTNAEDDISLNCSVNTVLTALIGA